MEKETRVNKYKELRKEMKDEVAINRNIEKKPVEDDDDFLAFIPKKEKKPIEDTLIEPLSYETLEDNDNIRHALNEAKTNVGKEQYNTRMDILNKIRQDKKEPAHEYHDYHDFDDSQREEPVHGEKKVSLLEKLAEMSPEEDVKELEKYEQQEIRESHREHRHVADPEPTKVVSKPQRPVEEMNVGEIMKSHKKPKEKETVVEEKEEDGKLVTVLNYVIIVFLVVFIILVGFVAIELFF